MTTKKPEFNDENLGVITRSIQGLAETEGFPIGSTAAYDKVSNATASAPKNTKMQAATNKGIAPLPVNESVSLIAIIQQAAANPDTDVSKMESLWKMKQEIDAKEEETRFNLAMGVAQSRMTTIQNDCYNPQTKSRYASYQQLDKALRPIYTQEGFALSFNVEATESVDMINIICYVTHNKGHSRTYCIPMPNDGKGAKGNPVMTKTHATGSASAYGMRYLLKMIFNIAVGETDDDGNQSSQPVQEPVKYITESQQNTIDSMIRENDLSMSIFRSWLDVALKNDLGIAGIPANFYQKVIDKIKEGIASKNK